MHRVQLRLRGRLFFKSLAARVLGLLVFVWLAAYSPVHLLLEPHTHDSRPVVAAPGEPGLWHEEPGHHHGGHEQHLASDHQWRATAQQQLSAEYGIVFVPAAAAVETPESWFTSVFLTERVNPPGCSAPAPRLPRAPPVS